ncbi:putative membrane protein [Burkholderia ambifaria AMMD]|uniref:Polysaccharide biosynthesis protein n=1 Tax=Burkholderia ambifaria (strain ATCC BAA-244 / DSM 16087 / CCUG 44356 / LMG 19182 / AMMD) TaxID=339670 RepID=Q0B5B2_BURCM|nr:hypothetical protein [Burkholderia ambifaria]ABI90661.1 hypothetical protein Bamb_5112 [Burkholderia ambifaria AMMD]AJY24458.1 putative membrane protein [Burkholderia ambifaria AMMD]MBR7933955.1 hypothetical protein [Burkholderia ambifaria]PEH68683.1 hypothetical protein CRM91_12375 [Burkholderia ambifaria]QQC06733.1 hypothetical protein I6H84_26370 [Burkholderia ambifaria]
MRRLNADLIHVVASTGLPALVNFVVAALALHLLDPVLVGRSYALLALFYVAIDAFNFGSARIYTIDRIRARFPNLLRLDCVSALGSTVLFCLACALLGRTGSIALPNWTAMLVLAPVCYGLSHFALGFFRVTRRNGVVLVISTISALSRLAVIAVLAEYHGLRGHLPDLLLLVEAVYGALLLAAYLWVTRGSTTGSEPSRYPPTVGGGLRWYRDFIAQARGEMLSSWYANAVLSGAKHLDVLIVSAVAGPAGAALYRVAKGFNNLAFNFGQSVSLAISGHGGRALRLIGEAGFARKLAAGLLAGLVVLAAASYALLEIRLFPVHSLSSSRVSQFAFVFAVLLGACLVFLCRILSLWLYARSRRAFVKMATFEAALTLALVAAFGWKFGAYGAICGVGTAAFVILSSSCVLLTRHATPAAPLPANAGREQP